MRGADGALLIVALAVAWSIYRAHRSPQYTFNFFDLLMEGGRVSRIACAFMTTLLVTSWVVVRVTLDGKLDSVIFSAYLAAWVAPIVAKLFSPPPTPSITTTEATQTTKKVVT